MRLERIDLNLFIVFEVIYREANLTKAAKVLNITQPAVSNALARLRTTFDDPLFQRKSDRMVPTPFAENLIGPVREAMWVLNNGIAAKDHFEPSKVKKLVRIGMPDLAAALVLPVLLAKLRVAAPGIVLEVADINAQTFIDELATDKLDICVVDSEHQDQRISSMPLLTDPYVGLVRQAHPSSDKIIALDDYLALEHIHAYSSPGLGQIDSALVQLGKKRKIKARVEHYRVATDLTQDTDLCLTLPASMAKRQPGYTFTLPFTVPPLQLQLYWHKSKETDPANSWLREFVSDTVAATPSRQPLLTA